MRMEAKMTNYITNTKGLIGSPLIRKQEILTKQAHKLGILPLSIYYYPVETDSDGELSSRLDGILSGLSFGDNVILQLPTMLGERYEQELIQKINVFRQVSNTHLILAVHNVIRDKDKATKMIDKYYNQADVLILPSIHYGNYLQSLGLTVRQLVYLHTYDEGNDLVFNDLPNNSRRIYLLSENKLIYEKVQEENLMAISYDKNELSLLEKQYEMHHQGGIGIIWPQNDSQEFDQKMSPSPEFNQFCLSGIPIIVKEGSALSQLVYNYNLGMVGNDLMKTLAMVKELKDNEYYEMLRNVNRVAKILGKGLFTSRVLIESLNRAQIM